MSKALLLLFSMCFLFLFGCGSDHMAKYQQSSQPSDFGALLRVIITCPSKAAPGKNITTTIVAPVNSYDSFMSECSYGLDQCNWDQIKRDKTCRKWWNKNMKVKK